MVGLLAIFPTVASLFLPIMGSSSWICPLFFVIVSSICFFARSQLDIEFFTLLISFGPVLSVCFHFVFMPYDWEWSFLDFVFCNLVAVPFFAVHTLYVPVSVTARRCIPFFPTVLALAPFRDLEIQTRFFVLVSTSLCGLIMSEVLSTRRASTGLARGLARWLRRGLA